MKMVRTDRRRGLSCRGICAAVIVCALSGLSGYPDALQALMIDSADLNIGYSADTDKVTTDNLAVLIQGETDQAVQLNYNFNTTDSYSQLSKNYSLMEISDLAKRNSAVRFFYRLTATNSNPMLFRFTDTDGDLMFKRFTTIDPSPGWKEILIPLNDFQVAGGGNGTFDLSRIKQVEIAIERNEGGSGVLDIDKIELVRSTAQAANSVLLDDFEGTANKFGGPIGTFTQDTAASVTASRDTTAGNFVSGSFGLKLAYNAGSKAGVTNAGYYNSPGGINLSDAHQIEFYAKSSNDNDAFQLNFGAAATNQTVKIGGIGKTWQRVVVPFGNFDSVVNSCANGGTCFTSITEFVISFIPGLSAGSGSVWIDDIRFSVSKAGVSTLKTIDQMEENTDPALTSWETAADASSVATLSSIADGFDNRALRMSYSLGAGNYCTMFRKLFVNSTLTDAFQFSYNYSGSINDFEMNILDNAGVRFVSKVPSLASTDGLWKSMTLPLKTFQSVSGGSSLDLRKLKDIRFTLLKSAGGKGTLAIDNLQTVNSPKLNTGDPNELIQSLTADNNPFSPNNDGVRDQVTFTYSLREKSNVKLRIFDSDGTVIKEFVSLAPAPSGSGSFTWQGRDEENGTVQNGLYFYQLKADSVETSAKGRSTGVVAALR